MAKGLLLLSGGLDSTLAGKLMLEMGVDVEAVNFTSPFCRCTPKSMGCSAARKAAEDLGIPLKVVGTGRDYLEVVKRPRFKRGSGANPCLDCRIFIFRRAGEYMKEIGAEFIITGEVLGERPMSQRMDAMRLIERESGLAGLIVRPLCAGLMPPSKPEEEGVVDRSKMLSIRGRRRTPQMELARELGISDYLCPAGGCLLTDREFSARFFDLLEFEPDFGMREAKLLSVGRHFRLNRRCKVVVGRNRGENEVLCSLASEGEFVLEPDGVPGPSALCPASAEREDLEKAASILARYTEGGTTISVSAVRKGDGMEVFEGVGPVSVEVLDGWRVSASGPAGKRRK